METEFAALGYNVCASPHSPRLFEFIESDHCKHHFASIQMSLELCTCHVYLRFQAGVACFFYWNMVSTDNIFDLTVVAPNNRRDQMHSSLGYRLAIMALLMIQKQILSCN